MAVGSQVGDVEDVLALVERQMPTERARIVDQLCEQLVAFHEEQIDEFGVSVGREQYVTVADVDPWTPPPDIPLAPLVDRVDLAPEGAQFGVGLLWMLPLPQKLFDRSPVGRVQVFEHGQMPATFQPSRRVDPRKVPIARASLAEFDEVAVPRLERAHPGSESATRRPVDVGPVALTAHRPTLALEMRTHEAVIARVPRHVTQPAELEITHPVKRGSGIAGLTTEFAAPQLGSPAMGSSLRRAGEPKRSLS